MKPPTKDQTDIGVSNPTLDASDGAIIEYDNGNVTENKDMARQEFAQEADLNYMLSKFKVVPERGTPVYGEWDDSIDLQTAIESTREARRAFNRVPEELQERFENMDQLLRAVETGAIKIKEEKPAVQPAETTPAVPPA